MAHLSLGQVSRHRQSAPVQMPRRGELGLMEDTPRGDMPDEMGGYLPSPDLGTIGSGGIKQVCTGQSHTCVLLRSGVVKCFGGNRYGQLGIGNAIRAVGKSNGPQMGDSLVAVNLGLQSGEVSALPAWRAMGRDWP